MKTKNKIKVKKGVKNPWGSFNDFWPPLPIGDMWWDFRLMSVGQSSCEPICLFQSVDLIKSTQIKKETMKYHTQSHPQWVSLAKHVKLNIKLSPVNATACP